MTTDQSTAGNVQDAILDDDKKLGEEVPGAPFAVVGLTYVAILGLVALAAGIVVWWVR